MCGWLRPERYKVPVACVSLYIATSGIYICKSVRDAECELILLSSLWSSVRVSVIRALLQHFLIILRYVWTISQGPGVA